MKTIDNEAMGRRFEAARQGGDPLILEKIESFLREAPDSMLSSLNPRRFAKDHRFDTLPTLRSFLRLAKEGVFNFAWSVHCPHCKGKSQLASELASVEHAAHCELCKADFDASFDSEVELSFTPNPEVLTLSDIDPFEASLASLELEPGISLLIEGGERRSLELELKRGNYLVVNRADRAVLNLVVEGIESAGDGKGESSPRQVGYRFNEGKSGVKSALLPPGRTRLVLENAGLERREFLFARLRDADWTDAALVSTLQDFRDYFAREMVAPGQSFSIRRLTILFTDIKGSTEMYERLGDSRAFRLVKDHFSVMEEVVRLHDGAIVKTIGDAIMAVFIKPEDAVRAGIAMIEGFDAFNSAGGRPEELVIKVGLHSGPCIAVSLNDRIDYFGTSVNMAARIQGLSQGRDIMVSRGLYRDAGGERLIEASPWAAENFRTSLKGLKDEVDVVKLARR